MEFKIDVSDMVKALKRMPDEFDKATKAALTDIKNDWVAESVDIAPIDTGNLRRQIRGEVELKGEESSVEIAVNATRGNFNYAYYIHESKGRAVTGEMKFLDVPLKANKGKYEKWLRDEYEDAIKKAGWK